MKLFGKHILILDDNEYDRLRSMVFDYAAEHVTDAYGRKPSRVITTGDSPITPVNDIPHEHGDIAHWLLDEWRIFNRFKIKVHMPSR